MARRSLDVDGGIGYGGRVSKVRKRGCLSSTSSSTLGQNYRLKRALLVGKRGGSTTPVPQWKMMNSESSSPENDKAFKYLAGRKVEKVKELPVSARKLAAILWEINRVPSPRSKRSILEDKASEVGSVGKNTVAETSKLSSEGTKQHKPAKRTNRIPASCQELKSGCNLAGAASLQNDIMQVCETKNNVWKHCTHVLGLKNPLKDVYDGLVTSKELLKVIFNRIRRIDRAKSTSLSLVSIVEFELDRACTRIYKLIQGHMANKNRAELLLKHFRDEKLVLGGKEQERIIHCVINSLVGDLEMQKKLRRKTDKLSEKLRKELLQTKASLVTANKALKSEKKAREMVELVCEELARGVGEDRAKVEELKNQSAKLREEVEKESEMLQLADMLREERVQMKLLEAKYMFEEKNALVDELRNKLEAYLKSRTDEKQGNGSPRYQKIKVLEKYLKETFPGSDCQQDEEKDHIETMKNKEEEDSGDSDLCSIELNMDDHSKSFVWGEAVKNESKRKMVDKSNGRNPIPEKNQTNYGDTISWEFKTTSENNGLHGFTSHGCVKDVEDEMKRYRMIKDLRDNIVSGSRTASSQDMSSPGQNLGQPASQGS
ncbi:uncharacterized protein At5g41620-like [Andrographis paniculata]|uniref:uncharacterized protein At5g41620-like n=1 Tax=Andrographis paniculata TaxID=175694 RepID=UPI0021E973A5|nr:uncharacterized protein At5g41620-like [Andrographis paniculata]